MVYLMNEEKTIPFLKENMSHLKKLGNAYPISIGWDMMVPCKGYCKSGRLGPGIFFACRKPDRCSNWTHAHTHTTEQLLCWRSFLQNSEQLLQEEILVMCGGLFGENRVFLKQLRYLQCYFGQMNTSCWNHPFGSNSLAIMWCKSLEAVGCWLSMIRANFSFMEALENDCLLLGGLNTFLYYPRQFLPLFPWNKESRAELWVSASCIWTHQTLIGWCLVLKKWAKYGYFPK